MTIDQALQSPVVIDLGNERISIPKMTMDDWAVMGAEDLAERENRLTSGMDAETKFRHLSFYRQIPLDGAILRSLSRTPGGIRKVIRICGAKSTIIARRENPQADFLPVEPPERPKPTGQGGKGPNEVVVALLKAHWRDQERLAELLADMEDRQQATQDAQEREADKNDVDTFAGGERPL